MRFKYRYGEDFVEGRVEDIATKMVAIEVLIGLDMRAVVAPDGSNIGMSHMQRVELWKADAAGKLAGIREWKSTNTNL